MRQVESSLLVAAYRRSVPVGARRLVAERFTPRLRAVVKRRLAASAVVSDRVAERRAARGMRGLQGAFDGEAADGCRTVLDGRRPVVALVRPFPSPLQAYVDTLTRVTEELERAGIAHACVRGGRHSSATLAVAEADRTRVLQALRAMCRRTPGYVTVGHEGRGRQRPRRVPVLGLSGSAWQQVARDTVLHLFWYYTDPAGATPLGRRYGCEIEFWQQAEGGTVLRAPRGNPVTEEVDALGPAVEAPLSRVCRWAPSSGGVAVPGVRTLRPFAHRHPDDVCFPVDAVYTWVDGADPDWLRRRAAAEGSAYHAEAANAARYANRDELRYSLRSLHQYAPWVRTVHLVTDDQVPPWLDTDHPRIRVVSHRDVFADTALLPTFNSHAIESQLHHIEGLAEQFLYLNDDVFFGKLTSPQSFFVPNGLSRFFLSKAHLPQGPPAAADVPVSVAGKNNREVLAARFGAVVTQKTKHVPHALRRSVLYEIEETFAERHRRTAGNRFRSLDDLSVTSSLHHYYAYLTGRAVPGEIRYDYFDLAHANTEARLGRLLTARDRDTFCLNDTVSEDGTDLGRETSLVRSFLQEYFPYRSPFERGDGS
jgi:hypothetical protein